MSSDGRFLVILDDKVSVPVIHLLFNQDNKLVLCKGHVMCVSDKLLILHSVTTYLPEQGCK